VIEYHSLRCILPPDLLERLARTGDERTRAAALDTMALDRKFRLSRAEAAARTEPFAIRTVTFAQFARLTLKHAQRNYGRTSGEADAVRVGWEAVKIPV
jgi:hypothetical protein